jgi:small-conductance mechanosensitive channel
MSNIVSTCLLAVIVVLPCFPAAVQEQPGVRLERAPVVFAGDTLFHVVGSLGAFPATDRARAIVDRLEELSDLDTLDYETLAVVESEGMVSVRYAEAPILVVTALDAAQEGLSRAELATLHMERIREKLKQAREERSRKGFLVTIGMTLLTVALVVLIFWAFRKVFPRLYAGVEGWEGKVIRPMSIRSHEILSASSITASLIVILKGVRLVFSVAVVYNAITYIISLYPFSRSWNVEDLFKGILLTVVATVVAAVSLRLLHSVFRLLLQRAEMWEGTLIQPVKLKTVEVLSARRIRETLTLLLKVLRVVVGFVILYFYVTVVFSFFALTRTWASQLVDYVLSPVQQVLSAIVNFLPDLFFILVIVFVTRYVIKLIKLVFIEMERGTLDLPGFYKEWSMPTYKIVRFLVIAFAAVVIFPYLPGADSDAFKGISVFLGILFSLGSAGAISNVVAGIVLTYMRPFRIGDRVKIADTVGDVIERTLLITRVRTTKNVEITVPNALVLGSHIINFSNMAKEGKLILHTSVTIGYDAPWKKVHELLKSAGLATTGVLKEPGPFVLQTTLGDFAVCYELNVYTRESGSMQMILSELHQNIQDKFNEAGVEIMSPHYSAIRDGNQTTIPGEYLPKTYTPRSFRIFPWNNPPPPEDKG